MTEFKDITLSFDKNMVFDNLSLSIPDDRITSLMGESGCGKSSLLKIAAGILKPRSGEFVTDKKLAFMFQEPRLLPWKNTRDNIRTVLQKENYKLADKYLELVGLSEHADKFPSELSGGMAQRVSLARMLAYAAAASCDLLMLDEPFSALDEKTRDEMLKLLKAEAVGKTVLLVTHTALAGIDSTIYI